MMHAYMPVAVMITVRDYQLVSSILQHRYLFWDTNWVVINYSKPCCISDI